MFVTLALEVVHIIVRTTLTQSQYIFLSGSAQFGGSPPPPKQWVFLFTSNDILGVILSFPIKYYRLLYYTVVTADGHVVVDGVMAACNLGSNRNSPTLALNIPMQQLSMSKTGTSPSEGYLCDPPITAVTLWIVRHI